MNLGVEFEIVCPQFHQYLTGHTKHRVKRAATEGCVEGGKTQIYWGKALVGGGGVKKLGRKHDSQDESRRVKDITGQEAPRKSGELHKSRGHAPLLEGSTDPSWRAAEVLHSEKANIQVLQDLE